MSDILKSLPRRLKIGHYTWRVTIGTVQAYPDQLEGCSGLTDYDKCRIYILDGMNLSASIDTVLHELDHATNFVANLGDASTEEEFVTRGTTQRLGLYLDNPRLWAWMNKAMRALKEEARREEAE